MFPIRDTIPSRRRPMMTWALLISNVAVFIYQVSLPHDDLLQMMYLYGIVPGRYTDSDIAARVGFPVGVYWPFLTSMFLHGGLLHLVLNMWMLWIFGDNVEDRMGHGRFLIFYLVCGIGAGVAHTLFNLGSDVPAIGASGAIAGVLAAYLLLYPFAGVVCVFPIVIFPLFVEVNAIFFILVWFALQFFSGAASLISPAEGGDIAWWAHIGGFAVGLFIVARFVKYRPPPLPYRPSKGGL